MQVPTGDGPEAVAVREVRAFAESGAPGSNTAGDEYLHLPAIVDNTESSPAAAKHVAATIRQYLSKDYYQKGYAQYNAIMLCRILTDNPGPRFTQNFDSDFISTIKKLLRDGKDTSVQQILRETLDYFEAEKAPRNDTLGPLIHMWVKEKGKGAGLRSGPVVGTSDVYVSEPNINTPQYPMYSGPRNQQQHHQRQPSTLPAPDELAARIEEAKTTARLLIQTVQSTPQAELPTNDLVKEFAERARSANKSIQRYMNCENPRPDEDTMLTLIETNDQLNVAMSKHQRTLLQARKATGVATPSPQPPQGREGTSYMSAHTQGQNVYGNISNPQQPNQNPYASSPPRNNGMQPPLLPQRNEQFSAPPGPPPKDENFSPPPGPPPSQRQQPQQQYSYENAYSVPSQPPRSPPRVQPEEPMYGSPVSPIKPAPTSSAQYGVAENPFSDDAYATDGPPQQQQPPQQKYSLFDRAKHHISSGPPQSAEQPERPGAFQGTPSYVQRQDSSANNFTMHGGSPPPPENR